MEYEKKYAKRSWNGMTVPRKVPSDARRLLVHNWVVPFSKTQPHGVRGFRVWTQLKAPDLVECKCGWSGLKHYAVRGEKEKLPTAV